MADINRDDHTSCRRACSEAGAIATRRNHQGIDVEHLLVALLDQEGGLAASLLEIGGRRAASAPATRSSASSTRRPQVTRAGGRARARPYHHPAPERRSSPRPRTRCAALKDEYVERRARPPRDASADGRAPSRDVGLTRETLHGGAPEGARQPARDVAGSRKPPTRRSGSTGATSRSSPAQGKLDPVIGRDEEIRRVIQVLLAAHEEQSRC